jgi:carbamoyltransferase
VRVLGVNCFSHDTAACLLEDGRLVALAEEERFNRQRHTKRFPDQAIGFCLGLASIAIDEVDVVAFAHRPGLDLARGVADALARRSPRRLAVQAYVDANLLRKEAAFRARWRYRGRISHVGHHDAHAASAFYPSPFERAAVLTLDRGGDFLSTTLQVGSGSRLHRPAQVGNPHSLGEVYSALTWYLGFEPNADEGKTMGLAPYGTDKLVPELTDLVQPTPDGLFRVNLAWFAYHHEGGWLSRAFLDRYGRPRVPESVITDRHQDLAFAVQDLLEETALHLGRTLRQRSGQVNLCLAGGVALNSVMNTRLRREAGFDRSSSSRRPQMPATLWGRRCGCGISSWGAPGASPCAMRFMGPTGPRPSRPSPWPARSWRSGRWPDPAAEAARLLAQGQIVGWFQGRAEVGPRALGARSILADPRRPETKDVVNTRVKRREAFRPFAPSVLDEHGPDWFQGYAANPFMLLVQPVRADRRAQIPAVTHIDGTARLQSVTRAEHPLYHRLISRFAAHTGVPVVLNTSFNLRGEPIVHRSAEAVADFIRSDMDALFLGNLLATKT